MTTFIIRNEDILKNALNFIQHLPQGKLWEITVKHSKSNLTGQQRNYWHTLVRIIADYQGESEEDMKIILKYQWVPLKPVKVEDEVHMYPISSEDLTKDQYSDLIAKTLILGAKLGLEMPEPSHFGVKL